MSGFPNSPISVDVLTLIDLAEKLLDEADAMTIRSAGVLFTMNDNRTDFAGGGLAEGATFQPVHDAAHAGLVRFLNDVINGLTTLGNAAREISATYSDADTYAADDVAPVREALNLDGPQPA
jgi:hypothetical protein